MPDRIPLLPAVPPVELPGRSSLAFDDVSDRRPKHVGESSDLIVREPSDDDLVTEPLRGMTRGRRTALAAWLVGWIVVSLGMVIFVWPLDDAGRGVSSLATDAGWLGRLLDGPEQRLFVIAIFCGALGGATHGLASLSGFRGNRRLFRPWTMWYVGLPLTGASMATIFMLVIRAGLLPGRDAATALSPYGVAGAAALAGLFTDMATAKLKELLQALFAVQEKRDDALQTTRPATVVVTTADSTATEAPAGSTGNTSLPNVEDVPA